MNKVELLAPAGDLERLKIAFIYGADAVYVGGYKYSLRANAKNFSLENLKVATKFAHDLAKKVYVTINILFHNEDLAELSDYLKELAKINVDAIIASDIIVFKLIKKLNLPLEMHLSTQASTLNSKSAKFYQDLGIKRVVLAREATKEDIISIKKNTNLEIEHFIHGAMCSAFSGQCVLSNYCTNRDSNRGLCAQVCRWSLKKDNDTEIFSITPKDLNEVAYIKDMLNIGIDSFKVEGRMRSIYYIATVIYVYRQIIDKIYDNTLTSSLTKYYLDILNRCANRESTSQFYNGLPTENEQYFLGRQEESNQDFLGIVLDYDEKNKIALIEQRNYFKLNDTVEFFGPKTETFTYQIHKILDDNDNEITIANHPQMLIKLPCQIKLNKNDMMRLKIFDKDSYL